MQTKIFPSVTEMPQYSDKKIQGRTIETNQVALASKWLGLDLIYRAGRQKKKREMLPIVFITVAGSNTNMMRVERNKCIKVTAQPLTLQLFSISLRYYWHLSWLTFTKILTLTMMDNRAILNSDYLDPERRGKSRQACATGCGAARSLRHRAGAAGTESASVPRLRSAAV